MQKSSQPPQDQNKTQGKNINTFVNYGTKKTEMNLPTTSNIVNPERNISPFKYYGTPNSSESKSGSSASNKGILQSGGKEISYRDANDLNPGISRTTFLNYEELNPIDTVAPTNIQEMIALEVKTQIMQFRIDVTQFMNETARLNNEKVLKNKDAIEEIARNMENYNLTTEAKIKQIQSEISNLDNLLQSEAKPTKNEISSFTQSTSKPYISLVNDQGDSNNRNQMEIKLKTLENQQKELTNYIPKLKEDLNKNVNIALNDIAKRISYDNEVKIREVAEEILHAWEEKLNNFIGRQNEQKANSEKQLHEDIYSIENKLNGFNERINNELESIKKLIDIKIKEIKLDDQINSKDKLENALSIKNEIDDLRNKIDLKCQTFEINLMKQYETIDKLMNNKQSDVQAKILAMIETQKNIEAELLNQRKEIDQLKFQINPSSEHIVSPGIINKEHEKKNATQNVSKAATPNEMNKWLETQNIQFKPCVLDSYEYEKAHNISVENLGPVLKKPNLPEAVIYNRPSMSPNQGDLENYKISGPFESKFSAIGPEIISTERNSSPNVSQDYINNDERKINQIPLSYSILPVDNFGLHNRIILAPPNEPSATYTVSNHAEPLGNYSQYSQGLNKLYDPSNKQETIKYDEDGVITKKMTPAKINFRENMSVGIGANKNSREDDELSLVYQLDSSGYLMDELGNYMTDDYGNKVKLTESQLEQLRANNILEEDN